MVKWKDPSSALLMGTPKPPLSAEEPSKKKTGTSQERSPITKGRKSNHSKMGRRGRVSVELRPITPGG